MLVFIIYYILKNIHCSLYPMSSILCYNDGKFFKFLKKFMVVKLPIKLLCITCIFLQYNGMYKKYLFFRLVMPSVRVNKTHIWRGWT
jgi:hypothetical protein